jgi:hypothetical protein
MARCCPPAEIKYELDEILMFLSFRGAPFYKTQICQHRRRYTAPDNLTGQTELSKCT